MMDRETQEKLQPLVRVSQLIVAGLMASVIFLTVMLIVVFTTERGDKVDADAIPIVAYVAAGIAVMALAGRLVIGRVVAETAENNTRPTTRGFMSAIDDPQLAKIAAGWQTSNIVKNALTEGAALINAVAYMVHGDPLSLGIVGILLVWMAAGFPTMGRLDEHIRLRRDEIGPEAG